MAQNKVELSSSGQESAESFLNLIKIMNELREGCPWDKKQTMATLRYLTIEETYELADAVLRDDRKEICNELGDLMLHIVFYSRIASETGDFNVKDVLDSICKKLIERHPHIYGDVKVKNEEEVKANWEKIKLETGNKSVLGGVPVSLPAMIKAQRIQEKARGVGFDWENRDQVWEKVQEELAELKHEADGHSGREADEMGDLLFAIINYARFIGVNPEEALERTNRKFINRFTFVESETTRAGKKLSEMTLAEMDVYWNQAKQHYK